MSVLFEDPKSPWIFIYISREYYEGKPLNPNRIGLGKTNDPHDRLRKHNSSSSKISTEVKFEYIYKVKDKSDTFFHNILKQKGYHIVPKKKEIFEGKLIPLTIETIQQIIESFEYQGPWIIQNNKAILATSLSHKNKQEKLKAEQNKINKYKHQITNDYNVKELIYLLNNKNLTYQQLHSSFQNLPEIKQYAYNLDIIKYSQLNSTLKLHNHNIIKAISNNELHTNDFLNNNNITNENKIYILKQLYKINIQPLLPFNQFTKDNAEYLSTIKNLYATEELKQYLHDYKIQQYKTDKPIQSYTDLYNLILEQKFNYHELHFKHKNNPAIQKFAFKNNIIRYDQLPIEIKKEPNIILEANEKNQLTIENIKNLPITNEDKLNTINIITIQKNTPLPLNDTTIELSEQIALKLKTKTLHKNQLSKELFSYVFKKHKFILLTPQIRIQEITKIPKVKYNSYLTFFDYLKIIIPVMIIALLLTLGSIHIMVNYQHIIIPIVKEYIVKIFVILFYVFLIALIYKTFTINE